MDFLLKQRLVGAIVLVALGVIFIPMLLEGPNGTLVPEMEELPEFTDPRSGDTLGSFPAADAVPQAPANTVIMSETAPERAPQESAAAPEPVPEADSQPSETAPVAEPEAAVAPEPEPAPVEREIAKSGPLGSWVVQVGSFSSQQNALVLRDKLRKDDFVTQVEKVQVDGKTHYRVRVGPFLERTEADRKQRELNDKFSLKARVLSYP